LNREKGNCEGSGTAVGQELKPELREQTPTAVGPGRTGSVTANSSSAFLNTTSRQLRVMARSGDESWRCGLRPAEADFACIGSSRENGQGVVVFQRLDRVGFKPSRAPERWLRTSQATASPEPQPSDPRSQVKAFLADAAQLGSTKSLHEPGQHGHLGDLRFRGNERRFDRLQFRITVFVPRWRFRELVR
jgi:hypothetical protein